MPLKPHSLSQYHVFLASPGDVAAERQAVRRFFEEYNRHTAHLWNARFEVIDWENYSTIGVGRPQELITLQTLERFRGSLALVIGIMGQRFGSPTGEAESGTEEEFNWAVESHVASSFPEIKWFFRKIDKLEVPTDPEEAEKALDQWKKVRAFRQQMQDLDNPILYAEYPGVAGFRDVFEHDLNLWLSDKARPWVIHLPESSERPAASTAPIKYFEHVERDFRRLDIAGIDNDRTFEIPLSEIYVRLRVMFDEDAEGEMEARESGAIDIQTALLRYSKLVIVGDPGSGKSTFLKYIALMLAQSFLKSDPGIARDKLCLNEPLPLPIFLSCWDLADFLKLRAHLRLGTLLEFIAERLAAYDFPISVEDVGALLAAGNCCLLFDGLDEVPTDAGRAAVSRMLEDCIDRYGDNRFVVTSRIRAYTGDTILKGQFTRCDIQPFDSDDRAEFIRNWVSLLFRIPPDEVETEGTEAAREYQNLTDGIEKGDRIRPLAVNPLLLTVISIVHWNRKRLPEQRVDLYDECVDVLLGQRKEAERIQLRKNAALDGVLEDRMHEERAWVRKRFAEIALHILSLDGDDDEASKAEVIKLLTPRFIDQGAANAEQASARAERFLDRQELKSGLLVSRRAQSYRFVHLTFQEYLAAWQLSNMDFEKVTAIAQSRLRLAKWFESLQLLGSQWAKESDDKADRYVAWLLSERGDTINDQAPVVALCANVVKDISGVAELRPETRKTFSTAVEATLDAFRQASGVPGNTQLEILEALGQLGSAVKPRLIEATRASLFQVRRRAIEMLLPHLSDDELFGLEHIWRDRSKEPVKTYLIALLGRDRKRAISALTHVHSMLLTCSQGVYEATSYSHDGEASRPILTHLAKEACEGFYWWHQYRSLALERLAARWPDETTRELLVERGFQDDHESARSAALETLAEKWPDENTRELLKQWAVQDDSGITRGAAVKTLAEKWPDENTRELLEQRAVQDESEATRSAAFKALAEKWPNENTREFLFRRFVRDASRASRGTALTMLAEKWPDETTRRFLAEQAVQGPDLIGRGEVCRVLGNLHSNFGRILFTQDLDGQPPYFDPLKPVTREHINKAVRKVGLPIEDVDAIVAALSKHLGWDITIGAKSK